uniref:Uncharacterized protein n=1 Tax=Rhinopithecus bieti TaxID=61621 RepID=A0A2K6N5G2_RHIBE
MHPVQPAKGQSWGLRPASVYHSSACPSAQQGLIKTQCFCLEVAELGALGRGRLAGSGPLLWGLAPIPACPAPEVGVGSGLHLLPPPGLCPAAETWPSHQQKTPPSASCPGWVGPGDNTGPPEGLQGDTQQPLPPHCLPSEGSLPEPAACQVCALRLEAGRVANKKQT